MEKMLEKYAKLAVKTGVNIQPGQALVINSGLEAAALTRLIVKEAYLAGASEVVVRWNDEICNRITYLEAPDDYFDKFPDYLKVFFEEYANKKAAFLSIAGSDPELMKGVNPERMVRAQKAAYLPTKAFRDKQMNSELSWSIVAVPTKKWAQKVFPNSTDPVNDLWEAIFKACRIDHEDPIQAWKDHVTNLQVNAKYMTEMQFTSLHFTNSLGTDLKVGLPEGHIWPGAGDLSKNGVEFVANIPTEEVFTLPHREKVNGKVYSSKPLNFRGNLIDEFWIEFKDGKAVNYDAKVGKEYLESLINTDEGSSYLGEVALVPYNSPISLSNILYYNTLFDENASCHLALGQAYTPTLSGTESKSEEELLAMGVNKSMTHVDFMFGTKDLKVIGTTKDGKEIPVFIDGNFVSR